MPQYSVALGTFDGIHLGHMAVLRGITLSDAERRFADYVVKLMNASKGKAHVKRQNSGE